MRANVIFFVNKTGHLKILLEKKYIAINKIIFKWPFPEDLERLILIADKESLPVVHFARGRRIRINKIQSAKKLILMHGFITVEE